MKNLICKICLSVLRRLDYFVVFNHGKTGKLYYFPGSRDEMYAKGCVKGDIFYFK
jgi:hypothetical protein